MKTSPKRSYSVIENERFGLVFAKTVSIISGTAVEVEIVRPLQNLTFTLTTNEVTCPRPLHRLKYLPVSFPLTSILLSASGLKGTVPRDFLLHESSSPKPLKITQGSFQRFPKFAEILASQGAPPVSTTPEANVPLVSMTPDRWCPLSCEYLREFSKKFETAL